jgi:hypothetical protein
MSTFIHEAGWGIWPVFVFGLIALAAACWYAIAPRRQVLSLCIGFSTATVLAGFLGLFRGIQATAAVVDAGAPTELFAVGVRESLNVTVAAFVIACIATLVITAGSCRRQRALEA